MNRREFTRGLATLGLTPALPLGAIGAGSTQAAVATATADKLYFVGWYTARLNKTCSPELLVNELNVGKDIANEIFGKLVESNTISTPDAFGVSRTIDPLSNSYRRMTGNATRRAVSERTKAIRQENLEKAKRFALDESPKPTKEVAEPSETRHLAEPLDQDDIDATETDVEKEISSTDQKAD